MEVGAEEEVQHQHVEEGEEGEEAAVLAEPGAKTSRGTRGRGAGCDTTRGVGRTFLFDMSL